ncbi:hypothetical protein MRX96_005580 [Rhipicephalus microplus]
MAQSVTSDTPPTSSFPARDAPAVPRKATYRKTNATLRAGVGGRRVAPRADREPLLPSSRESSESGDLNLVLPPRPPRRVMPQMIGRLQSSRRAAVALSAALAAVLLTVPMVAVLVSGKAGAWRSSGPGPCDVPVQRLGVPRRGALLRRQAGLIALYTSQSPGYAYLALRELATAYVAQDADRMHQNRHHFGHQILLFVASCAQESSRTSRETDSLSSVLRYLDIEGWPFRRDTQGPQERGAHRGQSGWFAGHLPLSSPLETEFVGCRRSQAQLLLSLHEHMDESRAMDWYREVVGRALKFFYKGREESKILDSIVVLEAGLARFIESQPSRKPPPFFRAALRRRPHSPWPCAPCCTCSGFARLTQVTPTAVMLNYIGYRLMVAMAPFLPGPTGEHLVSLSVEGRRIPGMERLQACVQLAEKVFGAALTVMLRHATPSLGNADTTRKLLGLAKSATDAMAHFVKQAPWLSKEDLNATLSRLSQTSLSLGVPREQPGEPELGQLFVDVPVLNERSLLESYFHMKTTVQRRYWSVLQRVHRNGSATAAHGGAWNEGLISLHGISSFDLAYRHDPERNSVLLPYGVLGFLARVQDVLPMHVPRFLHYALRGLFAALADMQARIQIVPKYKRAQHLGDPVFLEPTT